MGRPPAKELTERELELMHVFWEHGELTASDVREHLARRGRDLAYTTVATLVRILVEKSFLSQLDGDRPFRYRPLQSFPEVSQRLVNDLVDRVFQGSRSQLLIQLLDEHDVPAQTRVELQQLLEEQPS